MFELDNSDKFHILWKNKFDNKKNILDDFESLKKGRKF